MRNKKYQGVIVPMVTPFTPDNRIDLGAAELVADHLVANGAQPFILGTTGESSSIPDELRLPFVERVVQAVRGRTLTYAGIAANCLSTSVNLARQYFAAGVDVVVAHLPNYYPLKPYQMQQYIESLADQIPGPIILYNIPKTTHHSIPLEIIDKVSHHPNLVGLKDSERNLSRLDESIARWENRNDFSFLIGWAAQSLYGLSRGADGIVPSTGNIRPDLYVTLFNAVLENDLNTAEQVQNVTNDLSELDFAGPGIDGARCADFSCAVCRSAVPQRHWLECL